MTTELLPHTPDQEVRWLRICIQLGQLQRDFRHYKQVVRQDGQWFEPTSRQLQQPGRHFDS